MQTLSFLDLCKHSTSPTLIWTDEKSCDNSQTEKFTKGNITREDYAVAVKRGVEKDYISLVTTDDSFPCSILLRENMSV
jgi:hypothetical protein